MGVNACQSVTGTCQNKVKRKWAFSNKVSVVRQQLMSYINIYSFLEDPEGRWWCIINEQKMKYNNDILLLYLYAKYCLKSDN
jgi:hypothetical protein